MTEFQTNTISPAPPVASDPAVPSYVQGFDSLQNETEVASLPIEGTIPPWLGGSLLRTGPALYEIGSTQLRHWFDGMAMLHTFSFGDGEVSYRNRFLKSKAYTAAKKSGSIQYSEFATDPCRSIFKKFSAVFNPQITDNGAVNVVRLGDEFLAMTETPMVVQFDPETLETLNVDHPADAPATIATAHPHNDTQRRGMLNYSLKVSGRSQYRFYVAPESGEAPKVIAKASDSEPRYVHSFGLTARHIILFLPPFSVNPIKLAISPLKGKSFIESFEWKPERGSEFLVFERSSGILVKRFAAPPMFCFHHVNAYEDGEELVVDLSTYEDAKVIDALYLDRLRSGGLVPKPTLQRFRLDMSGPREGTTVGETLYDGYFELPRINYRRNNGKRYQYAYGVGRMGDGAADDVGIFDAIVKVDVDSGESKTWFEAGSYPSEPVFVSAPDAQSEDDGVLLTVALNTETGESQMIVLDAGSLEELARASAPHCIPFGFHGSYFGDV